MSRSERLNFPDAPRSELERSIGELVVNAQHVLATQGRLRHLLEANRAVVEQLDLAQVLRRIAEAAVSLVDARYGALGVIAPDGSLEQFIHVGISEADATRIGHLPEGHGLLGAVVEAAEPIRLDDLDADARSSGFPAQHPHMDSFLGVPIRVRDEVYGNLYLTNRLDGPFTQEDEDLITALAATAGIAIDNARLFDESQRRQRWSAAIADVTSTLLSDESDATGSVLDIVAAGAASAIDVDRVTIVPPGQTAPPQGDAILLEVPLLASGQLLGTLMMSRDAAAAPFTSSDLDLATQFTSQAGFAVELAHRRIDSRQLELVEDRNRIARDLHDHVIQRLFASGLGLQSLIARAPLDLQSRIGDQVEAVDAAIAEIRTAVFTLSSRPTLSEPATRHRVLDVVSELSGHFASAPRLTFSGPVDLLVDGELAADVIAVVREGLTNVARHAQSTHSSVDISVIDDRVSVTIDDDGRGMPSLARRSSGTSNLATRARNHGGEFQLAAREPQGTSLQWSAPLPVTA